MRYEPAPPPSTPGHLKKASVTYVKSVGKRDLEQRRAISGKYCLHGNGAFPTLQNDAAPRNPHFDRARMQFLAFPNNEGELIRKEAADEPVV